MFFAIVSKRPCSLRYGLCASVSFAAFALSGSAFAQQSASPDIALPTVVVSATGVPTPAEQIANSVTLITSQDLEAQQRRTFPDALATVPGLNIVQGGGPGSQTSIFMRGTNSNHVKVLIDGIDVTDPSNANNAFDFGQLLTGDIERIEVLRGPQSGLYGSDAIGGVISVITKKGEGPFKANAAIEGGSFGTLNQKLGFSGAQSIFNYAVTLNHFRSTETPVTPLRSLLPGTRRNNDIYDNLTLSTKLGADINEHLAVNYVGRYMRSRLDFTGDAFDLNTFNYYPSQTQSTQAVHAFYTRGEIKTMFFDNRLTNYAGVNYSDTWNWNKSADPDATINNGQRLKYDWRSVIAAAPELTLIFGADHQTDRLWQNAPFTDARQYNTGVYAEWQSNIGDRFFLAANARFDHNVPFGDRGTYRVAPAFIVPETETKLKASFGTGFKAPTLSQLYVSYPAFFFFGNPDLKPETSVGYDIGFEQPLLDNRLRFGATYFHNTIANLINSTFTSWENIGQAKTWGTESFISLAVTDTLSLRADYTYTRAVDERTRLDLQRRPRHKGSFTVLWKPYEPLLLSATVLSVSDWIDNYDRNNPNPAPNGKAPGYTVVNLAANYKVDKNVDLFARVDNLFNLRYENPLGFQRPGLGAYGGMRLAY